MFPLLWSSHRQRGTCCARARNRLSLQWVVGPPFSPCLAAPLDPPHTAPHPLPVEKGKDGRDEWQGKSEVKLSSGSLLLRWPGPSFGFQEWAWEQGWGLSSDPLTTGTDLSVEEGEGARFPHHGHPWPGPLTLSKPGPPLTLPGRELQGWPLPPEAPAPPLTQEDPEHKPGAGPVAGGPVGVSLSWALPPGDHPVQCGWCHLSHLASVIPFAPEVRLVVCALALELSSPSYYRWTGVLLSRWLRRPETGRMPLLPIIVSDFMRLCCSVCVCVRTSRVPEPSGAFQRTDRISGVCRSWANEPSHHPNLPQRGPSISTALNRKSSKRHR